MQICTLLLLIALPLLTTCQVMAQNSGAYDMIPGDAAFVVRLRAPDQTIDDLTNFADKVQSGFGAFVRAQTMSIGSAIDNPSLGGVDRSKDWYLVTFADSDNPPEMVVLVPAIDAVAMKKAVGGNFQYAEKDGWVAYASKAELIEQMKACFGRELSPISDHMDERILHELTSGHLTVFVNSDSLKKNYATQLAQAEEKLNEFIEQMGEKIEAGNSGLDIEYVLDMYRGFCRCVIQGVRDSKSAVVSLHITDRALQIEELLTVIKGSQSDTVLTSQPVSDMSRLKSIPQGLTGYWGLSGDPEPLMNWAGEILESLVKEEAIEKKLMKSIATMREVRFGAVTGGGDIVGDGDAAIRYFGLSEIKPASKVREALFEFGSEMEYEIAGIKQTQSFERDAEKIEGQSIDHYRFKQTIPPELDPTGMQNALNDRLYGPDGMTQRLAFRDDLLMQTMGGGPDSMKQLLAPTTWSDAKLLEARSRQHEKANVLFLVDIPNIILKFAKLIISTGSLPIPIQAEQLEPLQLAPSYAGFSVAAEFQRLHMRTTLPVETFQGFTQIATFVQGLRSGGR